MGDKVVVPVFTGKYITLEQAMLSELVKFDIEDVWDEANEPPDDIPEWRSASMATRSMRAAQPFVDKMRAIGITGAARTGFKAEQFDDDAKADWASKV